MSLPAWQTGELDEEWVESSPSPPPSIGKGHGEGFPVESLPNQNADSIRAKRGSLRALGHSAARALPPSRSNSLGTPRVISGHSDGRVLSERADNLPNTSDLPSPPNSRSSSDADGENAVAGTFLVKDGVDDDRGKHLARNAGKKGRDMFGPSALEKMFQPPSPPQAILPPVAENSSSNQAEPSTSPPGPPLEAVRRASHPYAPVNPSRLSKSVTPSTDSGSSFSATHPIEEADLPDDSTQQTVSEQNSLFVDVVNGGNPGEGAQLDRRNSENLEPDQSPLGHDGKYPFTFEAPGPSFREGSSSFEPAASPFNAGEPSHSTVHRRLSNQHRSPKGAGNPGLRLFRNTYDTYTRDHLSAVIDTIAVEESPSPSAQDRDPRQWHAEDTPSRSDGSRLEKSLSRESDESDMRSSKRMRMSPSSPARRPPGVKDWAAQGTAMMDRLRARMADSDTSASRSLGSQEQSENAEYEDRQIQSRQSTSPPISPPIQTRHVERRTHRSNPSTTSSGYLRAAEDLMAKIRARVGSESTTDIAQSPGTSVVSSIPSATSSEWELAAMVAAKNKGKGKVEPSPRRMLRRLSASEEVRRAAAEDSSSDDQKGYAKQQLEQRRPISAASSDRAPTSATGGTQVNVDDLNRFVSATTVATATTVSTSFVKHAGPRHRATQGPGAMRVIKPDEVLDVVPERVGRMRYDQTKMRWVREGLVRVEERSEGRASRSRSEETEDVFAGLDSWGRSDGRQPTPALAAVEEQEAQLDSSSEDEEFNPHADTTQIVDHLSASESEDAVSDREEELPLRTSLPHGSPPTRPVPHHASSAPPIMTPTPNLSLPKPIRSALRNANSLTPAIVKRTQWHESVTPAAGSSARRSVSFSDGKKTGRIRGLHQGQEDLTEEGDEGWFRSSENTIETKSWLPSARTQRIEGVLREMEDLSLEEPTPSKPPRTLVDSPEKASDGDRTVRQVDPSLVSKRSFRTRADANATFLTECSFGVAHDQLVQLITDVHGSEPYWEHLTSLDLRGKGADSVARLKEFLPELEEVYLNDNKLSYLSGIPTSVRTLHVANNRLTSLTSVDHLRNLQYLDVSGNQLDSVTQLACLTHLRELTADNNAIRDLAGIAHMDGLYKLSVQKNKLESLDLSHVKWQRMESLNVSGNLIRSVKGVEDLANLKELVIESNDLTELRPSRMMNSLRVLKVSDNQLHQIDLSLFPRIRTLYADWNNLKTLTRAVTGSSRIENLSLRNQRVKGLHIAPRELDRVKRLYISGNSIEPDFFPSQPMYSLLYLEAAACNLSTWPVSMASNMPSIKILNLNYNYLEHLDGLAGMQGLRKFTAVGCRLGGKGEQGVITGLKRLTSLEEVDLRMNPSTLSFYLPLTLPPRLAKVPTSTTTPLPQNPLPSVTLATICPPTPTLSAEDGKEWSKLDAQFRRSLPDAWYSKRLIYRGLIMTHCSTLRMLDGVRVEEGEKRKARMLLEAARGS